VSGRRLLLCALGWAALANAPTLTEAGIALAQEPGASPRQIAPDRFQPALDAGQPDGEVRAAIVAPTKERPFGACVMSAHDWIACINATATLSDQSVDEAERRVEGALARRPKLNGFLRQSVAKALARLDADWRAFRDRECQDLALIEHGLPSSIYEARLVCRIRRNLERAEALEARYGEAGGG